MSQKIQIDELMTLPEAAKWMKLSEREVLAKSKGRRRQIAAYWLNRRVVRFHPRAILAKLAEDNGATPQFISAMFGERSAQ